MSPTGLTDGWRLAVGTLTAMPVPAPRRVDPTVARISLLLAPLAVLPLALGVGLLVWAGGLLLDHGAPVGVPVILGWLAVGLLALGTRAFHLDGLADTADGLTSSYDAARSLQVMRAGDVGPAGVAAVVVVLGVQAGALAALAAVPGGALLAGAGVVASRAVLPLLARRGVPAAPGSALGCTYTDLLAGPVVVGWSLAWLAATAAVSWPAGLLGSAGLSGWLLPLGSALAGLAVTALVRRARRRIGGVTGDVMGASIEISLALLWAVAAIGAGWTR